MIRLTDAETARLPAWAAPHPTDPNAVLVDPDKLYPALLGEFGVAKPDKYWIEVCYQCMKLDLQTALRRFGFTIHLRGDDGRAQRWKLAAFPGTAADVARATTGREAREHYRRLRGFIPA